MRFVRQTILLAAATFAVHGELRTPDLQVRLVGDDLRIAAPNLHFLKGKPLQNLRDGASVAFDVQVSILGDGRSTVLRRAADRFVVSYDLWEEKFSVTRMREDRPSASRLSAAAAEAWALSRFSLPTAGLPADKPIWVRIDVRAQNGRDGPDRIDDGPLSLAALIELFSKPARPNSATQWHAESGPVLLAELRRPQR